MPTTSAIVTPRITNHSSGRTLVRFATTEPLMAVIIGEAIRNARTPAISVRRNENRSPSSRRAPNANTSTVSAVNTKISGSTRTVIVIAGPFQLYAGSGRPLRTARAGRRWWLSCWRRPR